MDPPPAKRQIPATFGKYFKTTEKAQRLMDPAGRLCELDRTSNDRELVFCNHNGYAQGWHEMTWSQASLWNLGQNDPTVRVARKALGSPQTGKEFTVFETDMFNFLEPYSGVAPVPLATVKLGYAQCQRKFVYLISKYTSNEYVRERVRQMDGEDDRRERDDDDDDVTLVGVDERKGG